MEKDTRNCTGCGKPHPKSELFSMPSGRGAYRRENYYCPTCKENVFKRQLLKVAKTNFSKSQHPRNTRPGNTIKW